ncbi:hypothetical protein [Nostoc sp.]
MTFDFPVRVASPRVGADPPSGQTRWTLKLLADRIVSLDKDF